MGSPVLQAILEVDAQKGIVSIRQFRGEIEKTGDSARKTGGGARELGKGVESATAKTRQGAEAAQLLSARFGIALPRSISRFLARSSLIGPALSAAFSVAIIAAFAAGLVSLVNNLDQVQARIQDAGTAVQNFADRIASWIGLRKLSADTEQQIVDQQKFAHDLVQKRLELERQTATIGLQGMAALAAAREVELAQLRQQTGEKIEEARKEFRYTASFQHARTAIVGAARRAEQAIEDKFAAQRRALRQQELLEIQKLEGQRQLIGLKELPAIQARLRVELQEIDTLERQGAITRQVAEARRDVAKARAANEEREFAKALEETTRQLENQAALAGLRGPAMLREKRRQMIEEAKRDLEERGLAGIELQQELQRRIDAIDKTIFAEAEEQAQQHRDIILGLERDLAMQRAEATGNFVIIALAQEKRRVDETIEQLKRLGVAQEDIDRAVELIHQQTVEQIASDWADLTTDLITGARSWKDVWQDQLKLMLRGFIQMVTRMILNWVKGLKQMADAWDKIMGGLGSPNPSGTIIFNFIPGFPQGGLVADALKHARAIHGPAGHVLAWVQPEEGVLNRGAMQILGRQRFEALNRAGGGNSAPARTSSGVPSFQGGGFVGAPPASGNFTVIFQPGSIISQASDPRLVAAQVVRALERRFADKGLRLP